MMLSSRCLTSARCKVALAISPMSARTIDKYHDCTERSIQSHLSVASVIASECHFFAFDRYDLFNRLPKNS